MTTETFAVQGMTCAHCVHAVTSELNKLPGVSAVEIDLATGLVSVDSEAPLQRVSVAAAVDEAGYELAP
ncbi:MAG: cation transporter [Actinomycetota bacterium]